MSRTCVHRDRLFTLRSTRHVIHRADSTTIYLKNNRPVSTVISQAHNSHSVDEMRCMFIMTQACNVQCVCSGVSHPRVGDEAGRVVP